MMFTMGWLEPSSFLPKLLFFLLEKFIITNITQPKVERKQEWSKPKLMSPNITWFKIHHLKSNVNDPFIKYKYRLFYFKKQYKKPMKSVLCITFYSLVLTQWKRRKHLIRIIQRTKWVQKIGYPTSFVLLCLFPTQPGGEETDI